MEKEFHYWITGIVARRAGFSEDEAVTVAHASQHVDDNTKRRTVLQDAGDPDGYQAYISQTADITKPKRELMRIYPIFHFLPGVPDAESARRTDGKMHILTTTPDSPLARKVLAAALATGNPYRIGIAAHAYADTWAHQNFVGWFADVNGQAFTPLPNIGHADFLHHPDWVGHSWEDSRMLAHSVDNNARFLDAARRLYQEFSAATGRPDPRGWDQLQQDLRDAMGPVTGGAFNQGAEKRMKAYRSLSTPWLPGYDAKAWLNAAVDITTRLVPNTFPPAAEEVYLQKPGWRDTPWFQFQEAVKAHQEFCLAELDPVFRQMGVDLRAH